MNNNNLPVRDLWMVLYGFDGLLLSYETVRIGSLRKDLVLLLYWFDLCGLCIGTVVFLASYVRKIGSSFC